MQEASRDGLKCLVADNRTTYDKPHPKEVAKLGDNCCIFYARSSLFVLVCPSYLQEVHNITRI